MQSLYVSMSLSALLSASIFLVVFGAGLGFLFMFLPTIPIFMVGLKGYERNALGAAAIAAVAIMVVGGVSTAALYLLLLGLPAWYICSEALQSRTRLSSHSHEWMPVGSIFLKLTLFACGLMAFIVAFYTREPGGIAAILASNINASLAELPDEFSDTVHRLSSNWSFLVFCVTFWLWALILYVHAWLAHRALMKRKLSPRHDFSIHPFHMPQWMLALLFIAALASLIGSDSMRFLGKSILISLALPYFLSGVGLMHQSSHKWPNRRILLFFIYFMVFSQFWPALIISASGLWHQIKHLSGGKTSSSS